MAFRLRAVIRISTRIAGHSVSKAIVAVALGLAIVVPATAFGRAVKPLTAGTSGSDQRSSGISASDQRSSGLSASDQRSSGLGGGPTDTVPRGPIAGAPDAAAGNGSGSAGAQPVGTAPPTSVAQAAANPAPTPPAPAAADSCAVNALLVPSCGVLTGLYSNAPGGVLQRQAEIGHAFDLVHLYKVTFTDAFPTPSDLSQLGSDTALFVDWDTYSDGGTVPIAWSQIASGAWNSTIDAEAARLRSYGRPIMVTLMHEMELANRDGAFGTAAEFVAAWQTVVSRMRADGATNVVWVWDMGGEPASDALAYYPGNDFVDWIAWDPYNWGDCPRNPSGWQSWTQVVGPNYDYFSTTAPYDAKPLMLAEFGSVDESSDAVAKADWLSSVPEQAAAMPRLKALVYFDSTGTCDWAIDSSASSLGGFAAMAAAGY